MLDVVESALNGLRMTPCPGCSQRALSVPRSAGSPCEASCGACGACWDTLADVRVVGDSQRLHGNCCAGFRRHELRWQQTEGEAVHALRFETWAQDHVLLRPGDVATVLLEPGAIAAHAGRRRPPMPLIVANHTLRRVWALAGSAPVATLR